MDPNLSDATPVAKPAKPGLPRAALLGGALVALLGVGAAGFYFLSPKGDEVADDTAPVAPPPTQQAPITPQQAGTTAAPKPATNPGAAGKAQAAQALRGINGPIRLETSFDNVPESLGGTGKRLYPPGVVPAPDNGGKAKPIVQGRLPSGLRLDPFVSRLVIPLTREFAYTLAVPIRLAPPAKPPVVIKNDVPPDIQFGPLPYVPRRVAGFLEFGGVSAIVETGGFGTGDISIVQPGATVPSGVAGVPPLTVESISSTEMVLRAEDGRTTRVALSGIPGGAPVTGAPGGGPGGPGGPPPGFQGGPGAPGRGGFGGRGGGGAAVE
jgi:hypothetical protein